MCDVLASYTLRFSVAPSWRGDKGTKSAKDGRMRTGMGLGVSWLKVGFRWGCGGGRSGDGEGTQHGDNLGPFD